MTQKRPRNCPSDLKINHGFDPGLERWKEEGYFRWLEAEEGGEGGVLIFEEEKEIPQN